MVKYFNYEKMVRVCLDKKIVVRELSIKSGISANTIFRLLNGSSVYDIRITTIRMLEIALELEKGDLLL